MEERPGPPGRIPPIRRFKFVGPGYIETMGNRLLAGRDDHVGRQLQPGDGRRGQRELRAGVLRTSPAAAIGKRIRQRPDSPWREIVGVVGDERDDGVGQPGAEGDLLADADGGLLGDRASRRGGRWRYAIRSARMGSPTFLKEIQQAVWSVNPSLPLAEVRTLEEIRAESMAQTSFTLVMLAIAAGVALLLGVVGIYGVIAYIAAQRTREIGIRMALGAQVSDVSRLFVRHGLRADGRRGRARTRRRRPASRG